MSREEVRVPDGHWEVVSRSAEVRGEVRSGLGQIIKLRFRGLGRSSDAQEGRSQKVRDRDLKVSPVRSWKRRKPWSSQTSRSPVLKKTSPGRKTSSSSFPLASSGSPA